MSDSYVDRMYRRWLLQKVLIECWTTKKVAEEIKASPKQVLKDFENAVKESKNFKI